MIEIKDLSKKFHGVSVIKGLSFNVAPGEVVGLLGPNGAGKSTTMKMMSGFLRPDQGDVLINGHSILSKPISAKKEFGYMPENAPLYQEMHVGEFLSYCCDLKGISATEKKGAIELVAQKCHLQSVFYKPLSTLSKGFKRRVSMGQSLLSAPNFLIWDEPSDGLDPNQKELVRELISDLSKEKGILISTHSLEEVQKSCSRILLINAGELVFSGTSDQMLEKAQASDLEAAFKSLTKGALR
jgi:ABC-2 type transport system ATP-binding protein